MAFLSDGPLPEVAEMGHMIDRELRILILEDQETDVELSVRELRRSELRFTHLHVNSREAFLRELEAFAPDLILMDYSLPSFDAMAALRIVQQISPHVPCIVVSGTIGEEVAIETLKKGATDYILKSRMARLVPAAKRALLDANRQSELTKAEARIRQQATLLDKARDAIILLNMDDHVLFWNQSAQRLYGWSSEEIVGKNVAELIFKGSPDHFEKAKAKAVQRGEWVGELRQTPKAGEQLIVESRWTLIRDADQKPQSILVVNTDITEKKKIESQLLRSQRMESIGMLAGGIAHDLNNILAPILMAAETLKLRKLDPENNKLILTIEESAQRGADMVKHVLMFARGVEGIHTIIQPDVFITDIKKILDETFPKSVQILTEIPSGLWAVYGDITQFQQVILNLCVNARDAMSSGGKLMIRAKNCVLEERDTRTHPDCQPGQYVDIQVSDSGEGIPAENLEKIFEPFFTTKAIGRGTGLGLSTVQAIIKSHGGFVEVWSEVGHGTTFTVHLPALEDVEVSKARKTTHESPQGNGEWIMVVDDEASIREMTKETLNTFGYNVLTAESGEKALQLLSQNQDKIKAVVVDMAMPVMDGSECMTALRTIKPGIQIILTSGLDDHQQLCKTNTGLCTFLSKPYTAERLLGTVHDVLKAS